MTTAPATPRARLIALAGTLALLSAPSGAQTLHDAVAAAWARNPELQAIDSKRANISARQGAAAALTPGPPQLGASYVTDQAIRNRRARETELSVSTPLWLPGEGTASVRVADAELTRSTAQSDALRLQVAGEVREVLGAVAVAESELKLAESHLRDARALEDDVARRLKGRDAAQAELLLARADRLEADGEFRDKRAALAKATVDFRTLTGMAPLTEALNEIEPGDLDPASHPRLAEARGALSVAKANRALAEIQVRESPEIGLVGRRMRDIDGNVYDHSIGIQLRVPFATEARNAPRQTAAAVELAEASAAYATAERQVTGAVEHARIVLENAHAQGSLAAERAKALDEQRELTEQAYRKGQVSLTELIRSRGLAYQADAAQARAEIGVRLARSTINQALGVIP